MPDLLPLPETIVSLADLLDELGVSADRVRLRPYPGTATEQDLLDIQAREAKLYELVQRVLVEKAIGFRESCLAGFMNAVLRAFVYPRHLGLVTTSDGTVRLAPGLVRLPDVAFFSWDRIPGGRMPTEPIPHLIPDLAVEVLSRSNTAREMARKCREYFEAGVRLVWLVDPETRSVDVYTAEDQVTTLTVGQALDGGAVLPGFVLPLSDLFAELDQADNG